ncbi:MAG: dihydrofolate reductase [Holosporales bacterium]|jgi:dihydrofolate reductase|nr:dihydrofolate reductase [Holosporales bacterium]
MIVGVMSCDVNGVIGKNGVIPWSCEEDTQFFRDTTYDENLIVGRKTFDSLPENLLNNRRFMIFSKTIKLIRDKCIFFSSLSEFIGYIIKMFDNESKFYMIGGAEVADLFFTESLIDAFILTVMNGSYLGDRKLNIKRLSGWKKETMLISPKFSRFRYLKP